MSAAESYRRLLAHLAEAQTLASVSSVLEWDQETAMPPKAVTFRAEEMGLLARLVHERVTHPSVGEWLADCEADPDLREDPDAAANLRELRRDYARATRLPASLVAEMSETSSRAMEVWKEARRASDFALFAPWLDRQIVLHRKEAACYGTPEGGEPYDALLETYEPGMRSAALERIFAPLREAIVSLLGRVEGARRRPDTSLQGARFPLAAQQRFSRFVAASLGYDFEAGRLDESAHPFTAGMGPGDTRITTRYTDDRFLDALSSTMHEVGHALYEQGLPKAERWGQPLSEACSLGVHESQSRLWENQVGRSRAFWTWALPEARRQLGGEIDGRSLDEVVGCANAVEPSLIRVDADEVTYNLHVMLRFDLERALLRGDLEADGVPEAWNARMRSDLGLTVPDDARGCLQDVHWSNGLIGYFPTYTLGNLYAAQLWEAASAAIPDLPGDLAQGRFGNLLAWLREHVHRHGRRWPAPELCRRVTGQALGHGPLVRYLEEKLRPVYGF
ncbi:MAG TPA: carboxypeptidase M32 [Candidatus Polarisedimenticolaceae bacterium]|nr:carboxypeptidase M32 [Candidatus Polarisedimenticolaceae bacterium]